MDVQAAVIGDLYAAGLGEGSWHDALRQARHYVGASSSMLFTPFVSASDGGLAVMDDVPVEVATQYFTEVAAVDVWYHELLRRHGGVLRAGVQWNTDELVAEAALRRTRLHADYLRPSDMGGGSGLSISGEQDAVLPAAAVMFYRPLNSAPFEPEVGLRVGDLATHFRRAVELWHRLKDAVPAAALAGEHASVAAVVVARDRRILFGNHAADKLLSDSALGLVRQARLCAAEASELVALEAALGVCQARRFGQAPSRLPRLTVRLQGQPNAGVVARVVPCPSALHGPSAAAVVFISREGKAPVGLREVVSTLYHLTSAEALLVEALSQGQDPRAFAEKRGVSIATVRTQLRAVFAKTGTRGQSELIKLVFSIAH